MTPNEALAILDRAVALAPLPRADHVEAQHALKGLAALVEEHAILKQAVNETVEEKASHNED